MKFHKSWTTVTPFSKFLAMLFFILFPIIGFYLGTQYQKAITSISSYNFSNATLNSGIKGKIVLAPTCSVQKQGQTCIKPYQATVNVESESPSQMITTFTSDKQGYFYVSLPPGTYVLQGESKQVFPIAKPIIVIVKRNKYTTVNITYETGIE